MAEYKTPEERREERYARHRKEENLKLVIGLVVFVMAVTASLAWGVWWFTNCANRAYYDAPMLCHVNSSHQ